MPAQEKSAVLTYFSSRTQPVAPPTPKGKMEEGLMLKTEISQNDRITAVLQ